MIQPGEYPGIVRVVIGVTFEDRGDHDVTKWTVDGTGRPISHPSHGRLSAGKEVLDY